MIVNTLKRAAVGFVLGIIIGSVIAHLTGGFGTDTLIPVSDVLLERAGSVFAAQVIQTVMSGIYGALCFEGISFYEIERWPLALATAAHCAVIVLTYVPVGLCLGWVDSVTSVLIMAAIQIFAFFIIWLIMSLIYKAQVKELNEINSRNHSEKSGEGGGTGK